MKPFLFNQKMSFLLRSICFLFFFSSFLNTFVSATQHLCHPDQRDALLEFKKEFETPKPNYDYPNSFPKTRSWVNKTDCCSWDGITCDAKSGKVIGLDLSSSFLHGPLKSNSSLFRLRHLGDLNLAYNNFTTSPIPAEFDNLLGLERLNLSQSSLSGQIPINLLQLTKLVSLDLSSYSPSLSVDESFLHLLAQNLRNLRKLDMSYVNISSEIPHEFSNLRFLRLLNLENCNLYGEFPSSVFLNPNLQSINLCSNKNLRGNLPVFRENNSLLELSIQSSAFSGTIPDSISNLIHLTSLTLSLSKFSGKIPFSLGNLSHLSYLNFYSNNFVGEIPSSIGNLKQLTYFGVAENNLSGNLPDSILNLTQLNFFSLSSNQFRGSLPSNISQLSKLETFDALDNSFQGPLFIPSRSIRYFFGSKNNFTGEIPRSICGLSSLEVLDLSNNNLNGSIPWCLKTQMSSLEDLNLSNNSLSGSLPEIFINAKNLASIVVSHNQLEGNLPASLTGCLALEVLNVGNNRIYDTFPFQLNSLQKLQVLVLRSNKFHGQLHNAYGGWSGFPLLKIIDVSHNDFFGTLPSYYFMNWTVMSSNTDNNMEPEYIRRPSGGYYTLVLMSKGVSMQMERILTIYTAIDFSGNKLHGQIPNSIGLLKELRILNLSSNAFTGHIPSSLANLTNLESLDLSQNKISGEIPPELGTLSSLASINVSHNQLEGSIPQGTQFQRQKCSSYEGNPRIFAASLKEVCGDIKETTLPQPKLLERNEEEETLSWIAAGIGFAPGVVFGLSMGYIVTSYKDEWFMKIFGRRKQQSTRAR